MATQSQRSNGFTKPQVRVLKVLAKAKGPLARSVLKSRAKGVGISEHVGCQDAKARAACDKKTGIKSLISQGLVTFGDLDSDGHIETVYSLTPSGKRATTAL